MEDAREEKARVSQRHPAGSRRETMQGLTETLCRVSQRHPNIQITNIKQPVINIPRPGGGKRPEPGRLDLEGKHREGVVSFAELLGEAPPPPPPQAVSPVMEAMEAAGVTDMDNRRAFTSAMMGLESMQCREVIHQFKSELRNGEMKNVRNLAALLMQRLKDIPRKEN